MNRRVAIAVALSLLGAIVPGSPAFAAPPPGTAASSDPSVTTIDEPDLPSRRANAALPNPLTPGVSQALTASLASEPEVGAVVIDTDATTGSDVTAQVIARIGSDEDLERISADAAAARLDAGELAALASDPTLAVVRDVPIRASVEAATRDVGVDTARAQLGPRANWGSGVVIAVIDTGVDPTHPSLQNTVVEGVSTVQDMCPSSPAWSDRNGHGTHVASIAAGRGAPTGVAPAARIVAVKVLNCYGEGSLSSVLNGLEWVRFNANRLGIDIANLSLGFDVAPRLIQEQLVADAAVNRLLTAGVLPVVAAGNSGVPGSISSPGTARHALTVGAAVDQANRSLPGYKLAYFSSRGPTPQGLPKPDLVAPGFEISAARPASLGGGQTTLSGTSMASPFAAGVAALVLSANPALVPTARACTGCVDGVEAADSPLHRLLTSTAWKFGAGENTTGAGMVNADAAVASVRGARPTHTWPSPPSPLPPRALRLVVTPHSAAPWKLTVSCDLGVVRVIDGSGPTEEAPNLIAEGSKPYSVAIEPSVPAGGMDPAECYLATTRATTRIVSTALEIADSSPMARGTTRTVSIKLAGAGVTGDGTLRLNASPGYTVQPTEIPVMASDFDAFPLTARVTATGTPGTALPSAGLLRASFTPRSSQPGPPTALLALPPLDTPVLRELVTPRPPGFTSLTGQPGQSWGQVLDLSADGQRVLMASHRVNVEPYPGCVPVKGLCRASAEGVWLLDRRTGTSTDVATLLPLGPSGARMVTNGYAVLSPDGSTIFAGARAAGSEDDQVVSIRGTQVKVLPPKQWQQHITVIPSFDGRRAVLGMRHQVLSWDDARNTTTALSPVLNEIITKVVADVELQTVVMGTYATNIGPPSSGDHRFFQRRSDGVWRLAYTAPPGEILGTLHDISADGRWIAFTTLGWFGRDAWYNSGRLRNLDTGELRTLPDDRGLTATKGGADMSRGVWLGVRDMEFAGTSQLMFSSTDNHSFEDTNGNGDAYRYDMATKTSSLVSRTVSGKPNPYPASWMGVMGIATSADARVLVFDYETSRYPQTQGDPLVPGDGDWADDVGLFEAPLDSSGPQVVGTIAPSAAQSSDHAASVPRRYTLPLPPGATGAYLSVRVANTTAPGFARVGTPNRSQASTHSWPAARSDTTASVLTTSGELEVTTSTAARVTVQPVAWLYPPGAPNTSNLRALGATRVLDTRTPPARLAANTTRLVPIPTALTPAATTSVLAAVTVLNPAAAGTLRVGSTTVASWSAAGQTVTGTALVPRDASGRIALTSSTVADVIVEIHAVPGGGNIELLTDAKRAIDTRSALGPRNSPLPAGVEQQLQLSNSVPQGATAVLATFTVPSPAAGGWLKAGASSIPAGVITSWSGTNSAAVTTLVPLAPDGSIKVWSSTPAHLVVDIHGFVR